MSKNCSYCLRWLLALLLVGSISACSPIQPIKKDHSSSVSNSPAILDIREQYSLKRIALELSKYQVVLVGESHTNYAHHQNQLAVIKVLRPYWSKMGIGLEFVQSPFQPVLDNYVAGKISDAQLLKQTNWYQRWGYDFRLYREIFHYARTHRIPLFALNAPRELTKKISKFGIAGLTAKDRSSLPKVITRNKVYRERLHKVFKQHSRTSSSKGLDNFVDVQLAWDESMAEHAAKAIQSGKISHMVLLAGSGHVIHQAIPLRIEKHLGSRPVVIVNKLPESLADADFVLHTADIKLPPAGKMGVLMDPGMNSDKSSKKGVLVAGLTKEQRGGLQKGDVILSIDGQKVVKPEDIKIHLLDKKAGDVIQLEIYRVNNAKNNSHPVTLKKSLKLL